MAKPMNYDGKPLARGGKPLACEPGDCCVPIEVECGDYPVAVDTCEGLLNELACMGILLTLNLEDVDDGEGGLCRWSRLSGTYLYKAPGETITELNERLEDLDALWRSVDLDCTLSAPVCFPRIGLACDPGCSGGVHALTGGGCAHSEAGDDETGFLTIITEGCGPAPPLTINGPGGYYTIPIEPYPGTEATNPLVSGEIEFFGPPCQYDTACGDTSSGVSFSATLINGCAFSLSPLINIPCEVVSCYWSDGNTECDRSFIHLDGGCDGSITRDLTFTVIDERGCTYEATQTLECGCDCTGSGSLGATQDGCVLTLTATVNGEECGAVLHYRLSSDLCTMDPDCEVCDQDPPVECLECYGTLGDGESVEVTICGSTTVSYTILSCNCDCPTDTGSLGPYTCTPCSCCSGVITGMTMVVSGVSEGDHPDDCDCTAANTSYFVPANLNTCSGELEFDVVQCDGYSYDVYLAWLIWCEPSATPNHTDYYLNLVGAVDTGQGVTVNDDVYIGTYPNGTVPSCAEFSGNVTGTPPIGEGLFCDGAMSVSGVPTTSC